MPTQQYELKGQNDILLFILSIIQGLAFTKLVDAFIPFFQSFSVSWSGVTTLLHFILSFTILIRVIQTYLAALLDYKAIQVFLVDLVGLFMIGAFEYWLFSFLLPPNNWTDYHFLASAFGVFSSILYIYALVRVRKGNIFNGDSVKKGQEIRLQWVNIFGSVLFSLFGCLIFFFHSSMAPWMFMTTVLLMTGIVVFNTWYSWTQTISVSQPISQEAQNMAPESQTPIRHEIVQSQFLKPIMAKDSDVDEICRLMLQNFGYVMDEIFDTSARLNSILLRHFLRYKRGKGPLGYENFFVVKNKKNNLESNTIALIAFGKRSALLSFKNFGFLFYIILVIFRYLGCIGLFRFLIRGYRNKGAVPRFSLNDLYISYILVDEQFQNQQIGSELIAHAIDKAKNAHLKHLVLDVRADNFPAIRFFEKNGFVRQKIILDQAFGKKPRIIMRLQVD